MHFVTPSKWRRESQSRRERRRGGAGLLEAFPFPLHHERMKSKICMKFTAIQSVLSAPGCVGQSRSEEKAVSQPHAHRMALFRRVVSFDPSSTGRTFTGRTVHTSSQERSHRLLLEGRSSASASRLVGFDIHFVTADDNWSLQEPELEPAEPIPIRVVGTRLWQGERPPTIRRILGAKWALRRE